MGFSKLLKRCLWLCTNKESSPRAYPAAPRTPPAVPGAPSLPRPHPPTSSRTGLHPPGRPRRSSPGTLRRSPRRTSGPRLILGRISGPRIRSRNLWLLVPRTLTRRSSTSCRVRLDEDHHPDHLHFPTPRCLLSLLDIFSRLDPCPANRDRGLRIATIPAQVSRSLSPGATKLLQHALRAGPQDAPPLPAGYAGSREEVHQPERTVPQAAKIPMSATSPEVVERMHHCIPSDSYP